MATWLTCFSTNQLPRAVSSSVVVPKVRVCCSTPLRTHATTVRLCTSSPQQRSYTTSIAHLRQTALGWRAASGLQTFSRVLPPRWGNSVWCLSAADSVFFSGSRHQKDTSSYANRGLSIFIRRGAALPRHVSFFHLRPPLLTPGADGRFVALG